MSDASSEATERAIVELDGRGYAARADGEWLTNVERVSDAVVFTDDEGNELCIFHDEDDLHYRQADGGVWKLEMYLNEGGVASFIAHALAPIDGAELHDVARSEA